MAGVGLDAVAAKAVFVLVGELRIAILPGADVINLIGAAQVVPELQPVAVDSSRVPAYAALGNGIAQRHNFERNRAARGRGSPAGIARTRAA